MKIRKAAASAAIILLGFGAADSANADGGDQSACPARTGFQYKVDNVNSATFVVPYVDNGWTVIGVSVKAGGGNGSEFFVSASSGDTIGPFDHAISHVHICKVETTVTTTTIKETPPSTTTTNPATTTTSPATSTSSTVAPTTTIAASTTTAPIATTSVPVVTTTVAPTTTTRPSSPTTTSTSAPTSPSTTTTPETSTTTPVTSATTTTAPTSVTTTSTTAPPVVVTDTQTPQRMTRLPATGSNGLSGNLIGLAILLVAVGTAFWYFTRKRN